MRSTRITRMLLSMAVALMLVGFTQAAQEKKEEPKQKTAAAVKAPGHKHTQKAMKSKMAHAKKKEMKEAAPVK